MSSALKRIRRSIAHLIDEFIREGHSFLDAVKITLGKIKGSYALGILYEGDETCFIGARNEAPLVIGLGEGEYFIASDIPPILPYTRNFIFMEDGEVALLSSKGVKVYGRQGRGDFERTEEGGLESPHGGKGRLQALHAQGDL